MEAELVEIIGGIMCTDTRRIHECTEALGQAVKNPQTLTGLCQILVSPRETPVRQIAVLLMNKRLQKLHHWQMVAPEQQEEIKSCMLQALIGGEEQKGVRKAIGQLIGTLVRHEADKKDSWLADLLALSFQLCSMPDPKKRVLGASIFCTLTDAAPDHFLSRMPEAFELFSSVLVAAQARGDMATTTVANMMMGMCFLVPLVDSHTEEKLENIVPLTLFALQAFAQKGVVAEFTTGFDMLDSMVENTPKLLNKNIQNVVEFCLETLRNKQFVPPIRIKVVHFVERLVSVKKRTIVKQKLLGPILVAIFEMICSEFDSDDEEDDYFKGTFNSPGSAATQALGLMAFYLSSEKLLRALLPIIEPSLQSHDPLRRRGAFMCIAVISEGCSEYIQRNNLEILLSLIIQRGVIDPDSRVHNVAFFALGQFTEHLQPEISTFAPQIMPVLLDFIHQVVVELKMTHSVEPNRINRIFNALEDLCEHLEDEILPHLPVLMERLFECMDQENHVQIRKLALICISAVASASKTNFSPYLNPIVHILRHYLVYECSAPLNELRIQAIDTLASIASSVGKENFTHLADCTVQFSLTMLDQGPDDPDLRRAIYCLLGGLSFVLTDNMVTAFPRIVERILQSVASTECDNESNNHDVDDGSDDLQVENDFVFEKEEATLVLKDFAVNSRKSFTPYLTMAFEVVEKNIDHSQEVIRKASIEALCAFVIARGDTADIDGVKLACTILMPKFTQLIKKDEEPDVVCKILEELGELFKAVKKAALPLAQLAESVVGGITDVLLSKTACQYSEHVDDGEGEGEADTEESEFDEMVIESAANLVVTISYALDPETYSMYFGRLYKLLLTQLEKAKKNDDLNQRTLVYGVLSECIRPLGIRVVTYFDDLLPVFLEGSTDCQPKARHCCFFGLGELVYNAEENSFSSFSVILQALSDAIARETDAFAVDNICGALARLIITNCNIVPLGFVLPVFMRNLPLREDPEEYDIVLKAFRVLYMNARPSVVDFIGQMVAVTLNALVNGALSDSESTASAVSFVKELKNDYPHHFNNVANTCSSAEVLEFVQNLLN
ncbi:importin-4-like [Drosophila miranda]|uniref:importin-4-like n=1 Tax=Drosophila miranda TaxID=7229 RepID=UPI00143F9A71|nr:importin-4-like [Drosophila miranda]